MGNKDDKPEYCYACHWHTTELTFYPYRKMGAEEGSGKWLCAICAATLMGVAYEYPAQYRESYDAMSTTIYCTHLILEALGKDK